MCPTDVEISERERLTRLLVRFGQATAVGISVQAVLEMLTQLAASLIPGAAVAAVVVFPDSEVTFTAATDPVARQHVQNRLVGRRQVEPPTSTWATVSDGVRVESAAGDALDSAVGGPPAGYLSVADFPVRHERMQLGRLLLHTHYAGPLPSAVTTGVAALVDVASAYLVNAHSRAALQDASDRSLRRSLHDELTGLPNRTLLLSLLEHAELRRLRTGTPYALFYLDLDGFKAVNDTHGHDTGDELLVAVARRLTTLLRPADTVARLHGDEFAILCEDLTDPADAINRIAARLSAALSEPFPVNGASVRITTSIGITLADDQPVSAQQVLSDADAAMYTAKRGGGNRKHLLDKGQHRDADLERDLTRAVERGELHLEYQPIFCATRHQILGFEALLRWRHPTRGLIPTAQLVAVANQSNLITRIGSWVLEQALTDRNQWQRHRPNDPLTISVNTSVRQLMSAGFADTVAAALRRTSTDPCRLILEMSASVFPDLDHATTVLQTLRDHGVRLALDHVGTGRSGLDHLRRFPVHEIKIDRTLTADLGHDATTRTIVSGVVHLAHALGITVVAEGVETTEQHHHILDLGVDSYQGFHHAAPMPDQQADKLIRS